MKNKLQLEKYRRGEDLCLAAMKHLAGSCRSYPDLTRKDWGDYVAIRLLDALYHLNSILKESQPIPVTYGFKKELQ